MKVNNDDEGLELMNNFLKLAKEDPRISSSHINLYVSLVYHRKKMDFKSSVSFFRRELIPLCKISGSATFHRSIKELHEYGYIKYTPSYSHLIPSKVFF